MTFQEAEKLWCASSIFGLWGSSFARHHTQEHTTFCVMNPFARLGKPGESFFRITILNPKNKTHRITKETKDNEILETGNMYLITSLNDKI